MVPKYDEGGYMGETPWDGHTYILHLSFQAMNFDYRMLSTNESINGPSIYWIKPVCIWPKPSWFLGLSTVSVVLVISKPKF